MSDRLAHFRFGSDPRVELLEVEGPSGATQILRNLAPDRFSEAQEPLN